MGKRGGGDARTSRHEQISVELKQLVGFKLAEIIDRLRLDHRRFRQLLDQLTQSLKEAHSGDTAAEDRLFCMIEYLTDYPHEIHHPTENLIFARLLEKALTDEERSMIVQNANEHQALERETEDLFERVDSTAPLTSANIAAYVLHQNQHMDREEQEVFPLAEQLLTSEDLIALDDQYAALHDPLFDAAESRFSALYDCLDAKGLRLGAEAMARYLSAT